MLIRRLILYIPLFLILFLVALGLTDHYFGIKKLGYRIQKMPFVNAIIKDNATVPNIKQTDNQELMLTPTPCTVCGKVSAEESKTLTTNSTTVNSNNVSSTTQITQIVGPTGTEPSPSGLLSEFKYTGGTIVSESETEMVMKCGCNPTSVTSWYKNKIESLGIKTVAISETNTNGEILNKLSFIYQGKSVEVNIQSGGSVSGVLTTVFLK